MDGIGDQIGCLLNGLASLVITGWLTAAVLGALILAGVL